MEKSFKFRIYPTNEQEVLLRKSFGCVRYVYNHYLDKQQTLYKTEKKTMSYKECSGDLTKLKKELAWLNEPDSIALQSSLEHLRNAYDNFFDARKRGDTRWGLPVFKSKKDAHQSYTTKNVNSSIRVLDKHIRLPKLGLVPCRVSKQIQGRILNVTVSCVPSGKHYVSICCTDVIHLRLHKTGSMIGLDLGLRDLAITNDDTHYSNHKFLRTQERKLALLQRRHSRKQIGSKNREKARVKVARLHEYISNCRMDAHHKLTTT